MAKKSTIISSEMSLLPSGADSIDPDKTYAIEVSGTAEYGSLKFKPAHNPYHLRGRAVSAIFDKIKPGSIKEVA